MEYNRGDKVVVTEPFDWDNASFMVGMTGTVLKVHQRHGINIVSIEWDHEDKVHFHSCGGLCLNNRGYNLNAESSSLALASEADMGNPLPDDPRLRGICIKIKQMEHRFKLKQLQKLKDKELAHEISQSISVQDGVVILDEISSITWSSTSSF
jgi:hypothetical protein